MAPLVPLACGAFVSSFLVSSLAADAPTAEKNTDLCLPGINLARTARLDTRVSLLVSDTTLGDTAKAALPQIVTNADQCTLTAGENTPAADKVKGLLLKAQTKDPPANAKAVTNLIQEQITEGLTKLGSSYDPNTKFETAKVFQDAAAQNLAYLMFTGSTKVGCAVTKDCKAGNAYILCKFEQTVTENDAPFSAALYKALEARQAAGIKLGDLADSDQNTPLTPPGQGSSALSAVPGAAVIFLALFGLLPTH